MEGSLKKLLFLVVREPSKKCLGAQYRKKGRLCKNLAKGIAEQKWLQNRKA